MKTVQLELVDEANQPIVKVPLEDYMVPAPGEDVPEDLDNTAVLGRVEDLIGAVLGKVRELNAEPTESAVKVRITISEALLLGAESEVSEVTITLKVRPTDEA